PTSSGPTSRGSNPAVVRCPPWPVGSPTSSRSTGDGCRGDSGRLAVGVDERVHGEQRVGTGVENVLQSQQYARRTAPQLRAVPQQLITEVPDASGVRHRVLEKAPG